MPNPQIAFPANFTPASALAYAAPDNSALLVSAAAPLPVAIGAGQASLEPAGTPIAGATMPAGGTGLTGWLSAIYKARVEPATVTGSATSAATVVSGSTSGYQGGSFQITSAGTGCTVLYEQSNDNVNWTVLLVSPTTSIGGSPTTTSTGTGIFYFNSPAAYVRARVSTYGSGTVTAVLVQKIAVQGQYQSLSAGNAYIGNVNNSTGYLDATTALGAASSYTGTSRPTSGLGAFSYFTAFAYADQAGTLYIDWTADNGTTWQVLSSVAVAAAGTQVLRVTIPAFASNVNLRVRYLNGGAAQGTFRLASSLTAN